MYYQFIHFYLLGLLATLMTPRRTVSPYTLASTTTDENALPMKINRSLSKLISHSQGKIHTGNDLKATLGIGGKGFGGKAFCLVKELEKWIKDSFIRKNTPQK